MEQNGHKLRILLGLISICLIGTLSACGGGGGDSASSGDLAGAWLSRGVNSSGEHTRLTFADDKTFKVEAYKKTSNQLLIQPLDQGKYGVSGNTVKFDFDNGTSVSSILAVLAEGHIRIDEMELIKINPDGSVAGGTIFGQIRIDDGSEASQVVTTSSVTTQSGTGVAALQIKGTSSAVKITKNPIRNFATVHKKLAGQHHFEKTYLTGQPQLVDAVKTASTFEQKTQALSISQGDLSDRAQAELEACKQDPQYDSCYISSENYNVMKIQSVTLPNDPSFDRQWGMRSVNALGAWAIIDHVTPVDAKVAIIDTGSAFNPDFDGGTVISGYDFISNSAYSNDGDGWDNDPTDPGDNANNGEDTWHGTHVAGVIGAGRDNNDGIAGVNKKAKIMHLRTMGEAGNGSFEDIAAAVRYAAGLINSSGTATDVAIRAKVVNMSLGCRLEAGADEAGCTLAALDASGLTSAIEDALAKGVIIVAAAGNCVVDPTKCGDAFYPGSYEGVIKVGGITSHGSFADGLSHFGHNQTIVAPSGSFEPSDEDNSYLGSETQIYSTVSNGHAPLFGTSQAAPFVSGAISMMLSVNPSLTATQLKDMINAAALDLGDVGYDDNYGHGLLNIEAAVRAAADDALLDLTGMDPAALVVSQSILNYGQVKTRKVVFAHKVGEGDLTGLSATKSAAWIKEVNLSSTTAPASVEIIIDRSLAGVGDHNGTVTISSDNGSEEIAVSMSVAADTTPAGSDDGGSGDSGSSGSDGAPSSFEEWLEDVDAAFGGTGFKNTADIGDVYILLINASTNEVYEGLRTDLAANYLFEFSALPDGSYYVLAGKQNEEGRLCDIVNSPAVPCTAFPSYSNPQTIVIQGANTVDSVFLGL